MNQKDLNSLEMYRTVDGLFEQQSLAWNFSIPVQEVYSQFKIALNLVENQSLIQKVSETAGITRDKRDRREELANLAFSAAVKMRTHAKMTKNNTLTEAVRYSSSQLPKCADQEFLNRCIVIQNQGQSNIDKLVNFNLLQEHLDDLQLAIQAYKPLIANRNLTDDTGNSAKKMSALVREVNNTIDILDDAVVALIIDTNFLDAYKKARKINNRRGRSNSVIEEAEINL